MHGSIESMDAEEFLIALVQIPPGQSSQTVLDTNDPNVMKFLRKYFKRMNKKPQSIFTRPFPGDCELASAFELSVKDDLVPFVPFIGQCADGSWVLRQFPVRRLAIQRRKEENELVDKYLYPSSN